MTDNHTPEKDEISGVETTGHEWDGIKELNNPAPRWWLWVFYACIVWSIGYWVIYPAWPTLSGEGHRGGTVGAAEWTQYTKLEKEQAEIKARRDEYAGRFHEASLEEISNDPELYAFALAGGKAAFKDNCATCHGTGGAGGPGYPNLNDDDWIWGGTLEDIQATIMHGIRHEADDDTRISAMPAYSGMLSHHEIASVAAYVEGLEGSTGMTGEESDEAIAAMPEGQRVFAEQCAACHGVDGRGIREMGAPNLADAIWLKSDGHKEAIMSQISNPKHGVMPAWVDRLDADTIRQLTIYVHSLGGGE